MQRTQQHGLEIARNILANTTGLADAAMVATIRRAFVMLDDAQRFALRAYGIDSARGLELLAIGQTRTVVAWRD